MSATRHGSVGRLRVFLFLLAFFGMVAPVTFPGGAEALEGGASFAVPEHRIGDRAVYAMFEEGRLVEEARFRFEVTEATDRIGLDGRLQRVLIVRVHENGMDPWFSGVYGPDWRVYVDPETGRRVAGFLPRVLEGEDPAVQEMGYLDFEWPEGSRRVGRTGNLLAAPGPADRTLVAGASVALDAGVNGGILWGDGPFTVHSIQGVGGDPERLEARLVRPGSFEVVVLDTESPFPKRVSSGERHYIRMEATRGAAPTPPMVSGDTVVPVLVPLTRFGPIGGQERFVFTIQEAIDAARANPTDARVREWLDAHPKAALVSADHSFRTEALAQWDLEFQENRSGLRFSVSGTSAGIHDAFTLNRVYRLTGDDFLHNPNFPFDADVLPDQIAAPDTALAHWEPYRSVYGAPSWFSFDLGGWDPDSIDARYGVDFFGVPVGDGEGTRQATRVQANLYLDAEAGRPTALWLRSYRDQDLLGLSPLIAGGGP